VRRAIVQFWGIGLALWLAYALVRQLRSLLIVLLLSMFLALALEPFVDRMERRGIRRGVGTGIAFAVLLVVMLAFLSAIGALLASQITELVDELPDRLETGTEWVNERFGLEIDIGELSRQFQQDGRAARWATALAGNLVDVGTAAVAGLFQLLTVLLFTFYLTADGPRLRQTICSVLPPDRQLEVLRGWELAIDKTGAYLSSRLILAVVSAAFHWVSFTIIGLPSAVALALWVGVLSQFVPVIGTYLAGVLPLVVALGDQPILALWTLGIILVYQQIENYFLLPRITASSLAIHPAVAFAAVIVGASLLGPIGAVLALPAAATVAGFVSVYVARHELVESPLLPAPDDLEDREDGTRPPG
jgi:predicted PurR-regulated permease PerM